MTGRSRFRIINPLVILTFSSVFFHFDIFIFNFYDRRQPQNSESKKIEPQGQWLGQVAVLEQENMQTAKEERQAQKPMRFFPKVISQMAKKGQQEQNSHQDQSGNTRYLSRIG